MKAVVLRELGEPEQLKVEEFAKPQPKEGEVVVNVKAAALNRRDVWIRRGRYSGIKLPVIPGSDGAGVVEALGKGVDTSLAGKEVIINPSLFWGSNEAFQGKDFKILGLPDHGTYAEFVTVPAENIYPKPGNLSWEEAAAIPLAGLTAYRAVISRANVRNGQTVLVTGIGGGVACFALQIAIDAGARVFVTSGKDEKIERAKQLGAVDGVNYNHDDWVKKIKRIIGNDGFDVVVDSAGGENFDAILDAARPGASIVLYGATRGPADNVNVRRIFWKQLNIFGSTMGSPGDFENMLRVYANGKQKPVVDTVFPLADAHKAHRQMEDAEQFGKLVLRVGS